VPRFAFIGPGCLISPATVATAYHEAGHAIVVYQLAGNVPRRISVIAKSRNLGRTDSPPMAPHVKMPSLTREPR
jgi:ATP-dependent Zn protease